MSSTKIQLQIGLNLRSIIINMVFLFHQRHELKTLTFVKESYIMVIRVTAVQVCDARDDDSSTTAGNIKKFIPVRNNEYCSEALN